MKNKLFNFILIGALLISFSSCIENEGVTFTGARVEFDAAIYNAPPSGGTFPILTRVPGYGRPINTVVTGAGPADPTITRTSGVVNFYVNLVGAHRGSAETINISVVTDPVPTAANPAVFETLATSGVHYTLPASITLDANSSVATVPVTILNPGATTGSVVLVIQLDGNSSIVPSKNYQKIALRIAQN